jgi:alkanesulfonate monooxygenase SsuD/methylene tetrahydromethanopterin reductase-like flavin-dependent oxidoreductase (luciferase family)
MKGATDALPLLKVAQQVEELGYDAVWAGDSFVARFRLEPMTLLASVAMVTDRVVIGTAAITAVNRDPVALAHVTTTLDQLSGGRLRMGIGTGAPLPVQAEYDAVTMSYRERAERVDEMVSGWRHVWNGEDADLAGRYYNLAPLRDQPLPFQQGGPALWLASNGKPVTAKRIAKLYDGWMPILGNPEEYAERWANIAAEARAVGRDPESITRCLYVTVHINDDADEAVAGLNKYTGRYNELPLTAMAEYQLYFGGSAQAFVDYLKPYVDAGAQQIILRIGSFEDYDDHLRAIADTVVPAFQS